MEQLKITEILPANHCKMRNAQSHKKRFCEQVTMHMLTGVVTTVNHKEERIRAKEPTDSSPKIQMTLTI